MSIAALMSLLFLVPIWTRAPQYSDTPATMRRRRWSYTGLLGICIIAMFGMGHRLVEGEPVAFFVLAFLFAVATAIWVQHDMRGHYEAEEVGNTFCLVILGGSIIYYGLLMFVNCSLDFSRPTLLPTTITQKKSSSSGKSGTSRTLVLVGEKPDSKTYYFAVTRSEYAQLNPGDTVLLRRREGRLGVPWLE